MSVLHPSGRWGAIMHMFSMKPRKELRELYLFSVIYSFAFALITIFEPIFFYQEGFSLAEIAVYYGLHYTLYLFILPLGGKIGTRFGLERSLTFSMPLFVLYFLGLALIPTFPSLFWFVWIIMTCAKILFWPAYHAAITKFGDGENRGTELSWMYAMTKGVGILGPLIGGLMATYLGFSALFLLAAVMALFAGVPLLKTKERYRRRSFPYAAPWKLLLEKKHRGMTYTMIGWGENLVDLVFWPIFMFIVIGGTDTLGFIASFNVFLMTLLGFFIGEATDRFPRRQILRFHVPFLALSYLFRPLATTPLRALLTDTFSKLSFIGVRIPMWYRLYHRGKQAGPLQYAVAFEMALCVGKGALAWILAIVFATSLPYIGFGIAFTLAGLMTFLYLFL